jgi:hypothetical protein
MAKKSLLFKGPDGLMNFEVVTLLGLMILDSKVRGYLFENQCKKDDSESEITTVKGCMESFFDTPLRTVGGEETGQSGSGLLKKWNGAEKGSKARIDDLLEWAESNRKMLDCLRNDLTAFLKMKYDAGENPYSECDFKAPDVLELLENARLTAWRQD